MTPTAPAWLTTLCRQLDSCHATARASDGGTPNRGGLGLTMVCRISSRSATARAIGAGSAAQRLTSIALRGRGSGNGQALPPKMRAGSTCRWRQRWPRRSTRSDGRCPRSTRRASRCARPTGSPPVAAGFAAGAEDGAGAGGGSGNGQALPAEDACRIGEAVRGSDGRDGRPVVDGRCPTSDSPRLTACTTDAARRRRQRASRPAPRP